MAVRMMMMKKEKAPDDYPGTVIGFSKTIEYSREVTSALS
jgi:hypothetical protein